MKNNKITIFAVKAKDVINVSKNEYWKYEECLIDLQIQSVTEEEKNKLIDTIKNDGYIITRQYLPYTIIDKPNFIKTLKF